MGLGISYISIKRMDILMNNFILEYYFTTICVDFIFTGQCHFFIAKFGPKTILNKINPSFKKNKKKKIHSKL